MYPLNDNCAIVGIKVAREIRIEILLVCLVIPVNVADYKYGVMPALKRTRLTASTWRKANWCINCVLMRIMNAVKETILGLHSRDFRHNL